MPSGGHVLLIDIAEVSSAPTPNAIKREGASRRIDVTCNVVERDLRTVARDIADRVSVDGFALLPLVLKGNVPGNKIERPMALVILGGLVTSTLLNLFLLPALYARWGSAEKAKP